MKTKTLILCSVWVLSSFLNAMPYELKKEIQEAQKSFVRLFFDLSVDTINKSQAILENTFSLLLQGYKKATDSSFDDARPHILCLKTDISFLKDLNLYMQVSSEENTQKLKLWANSNRKFALIVDKALSIHH